MSSGTYTKLSSGKTDSKDISIVPDLTARQRKEEKDLRKEAERLNSELSREDSLNYSWKTVGPRGEKRLVKVKIREGEKTNKNGKRPLSPQAQAEDRNVRTRQSVSNEETMVA